MFSGIIRDFGIVEGISGAAADTDAGNKLFIRSSLFDGSVQDDLPKTGDSIAVNGTCLTVLSLQDSVADFDVGSETLRKTSLGSLNPGATVNLERSVRYGDRIDGHLVQGHVDGVGEIVDITVEYATKRIDVRFPPELKRFFAPKGAVSLDGISLTLGEVRESSFSVYMIPFTTQHTTASEWRTGTKVNIEVDALARYVAHALGAYLEDQVANAESAVGEK